MCLGVLLCRSTVIIHCLQEFDDLLHTPKRRKLRTTSRYIYETLFVEGRDSDLTLNALSREWKLHKVEIRRVVVNIRSCLTPPP